MSENQVPAVDTSGSKLLLEADPASLNELFNRDPEGYSEVDLGRLIEVLREQRARWVKAQAEAGGLGRTKSAVSPATAAKRLVSDRNIGDLDL